MFGPRPLAMHSGYMTGAYDSTKKLTASARAALALVEFDTMVGIGLSGSLVVPLLARALDARWLILRKESESSHSAYPAEGDLGARWLFVDDFIATGATLRGVHRTVEDICSRYEHESEFAGVYCYQHSEFDPPNRARIKTKLRDPHTNGP